VVAVDGLDLSVAPGEIFGVVGPNGAGKTTTVECIAGLRVPDRGSIRVPDRGSIRVLGLDPQADRNEVRQRVGVQLQESAFPAKIRVREVLELFGSFYRHAVNVPELVESLGLAAHTDAYYRALSGGLKQRGRPVVVRSLGQHRQVPPVIKQLCQPMLGPNAIVVRSLGQRRRLPGRTAGPPAATGPASRRRRPAGSADVDLVEALGRAGLTQWFTALSHGLDTVIGAGGRGVSGGERVRLGLARALLSRRPVLLLDEPVAHLDHATAESVMGDLARSATGQSVVMVSNRRDALAGFELVIDLSVQASEPANKVSALRRGWEIRLTRQAGDDKTGPSAPFRSAGVPC
jgi:ABC-type transport system involved in cytochrome bd biosynthesis fused ATPase/permease subunit